MDMNRIRYFSVLAELKHVRKAAEVLHLNPASLSKAIKTLEQEMGAKLIVASGRGIDITEEGMKIYRQSQSLLREYNSFKKSISETEEAFPKTLRLGSMEVFTTYFLSKLMERESFEQGLRVHYLTPGKIEESLKLKEIDVGLTYIRLAEEELDYIKVGEFQMRIFGHKTMREKKVSELPFAAPISGIDTPAITLQSLDGWPNETFPRRIKYELELLETALQFARIGRAVVYCPDFVAKFHNESMPSHLRLHEIPLPPGFKSRTLPIYVVKRAKEEETPFVRKLAKIARSVKQIGADR